MTKDNRPCVCVQHHIDASLLYSHIDIYASETWNSILINMLLWRTAATCCAKRSVAQQPSHNIIPLELRAYTKRLCCWLWNTETERGRREMKFDWFSHTLSVRALLVAGDKSLCWVLFRASVCAGDSLVIYGTRDAACATVLLPKTHHLLNITKANNLRVAGMSCLCALYN